MTEEIKLLTEEGKLLTEEIKLLTEEGKLLTEEIKLLTEEGKLLTNTYSLKSAFWENKTAELRKNGGKDNS